MLQYSTEKGKEQNSPLLCTWVIVQCLRGRAHNIPFIHPPQLKPVPGVICAMQGGAAWKQLWDMVGCRGMKGFLPWHHNQLCCTCMWALDKANWSQQPSLLSHTVHSQYQRAIDWEHILLHYYGCMLQQSSLIFHPGEKEGKKNEARNSYNIWTEYIAVGSFWFCVLPRAFTGKRQ